MKLYYAPGTISLMPHVALLESDLPFVAVRVDEASVLRALSRHVELPSHAVPSNSFADDKTISHNRRVTHLFGFLAFGNSVRPAYRSADHGCFSVFDAWFSPAIASFSHIYAQSIQGAEPREIAGFKSKADVDDWMNGDRKVAWCALRATLSDPSLNTRWA
jgi:hypothetical protein